MEQDLWPGVGKPLKILLAATKPAFKEKVVSLVNHRSPSPTMADNRVRLECGAHVSIGWSFFFFLYNKRCFSHITNSGFQWNFTVIVRRRGGKSLYVPFLAPCFAAIRLSFGVGRLNGRKLKITAHYQARIANHMARFSAYPSACHLVITALHSPIKTRLPISICVIKSCLILTSLDHYLDHIRIDDFFRRRRSRILFFHILPLIN